MNNSWIELAVSFAPLFLFFFALLYIFQRQQKVLGSGKGASYQDLMRQQVETLALQLDEARRHNQALEAILSRLSGAGSPSDSKPQ